MSTRFPLIQLPRKSEASDHSKSLKSFKRFPLIQLPRKSEVFKGKGMIVLAASPKKFPLIQLPRKSEEKLFVGLSAKDFEVSINSTSEEVRSFYHPSPHFGGKRVSINSTSEEVRRPWVLPMRH